MSTATLRTLLVDDEAPARERLRRLLAPFTDVEVVGEAANGEEAIEQTIAVRPDLIFLDVEMPGCSGLEVAVSLPSPAPRVIFCTAYDEYALKAFEVRAVDYLLKPVNRARLADALDRVRKQQPGAVAVAAPRRFVGKRRSSFQVVDRERVHYFSSEDGLTQLHAADLRLWMEPSLSELEHRLEGAGFFRISRQTLVHLAAIAEVIPLVGGHGQVRLKNNETLDVSRRRLKELLRQLGEK